MTGTVTISVKLFAAIRQHAGIEQLQLELPANSRFADVRNAMASRFPDLAPLLSRCMYSIDSEYAIDATAVPVDAEIACIPPVSGG